MADLATAPDPNSPARSESRPAAERGTLEVRERAAKHMAELAAAAVPGTVRVSAGLARLRDRDFPHANVRVQGTRAWVELDIAATWPCPVSELATRARDHVLAELGEKSGLDVNRVDVQLHIVDRAQVDRSSTRRVQ